MKKASTISKERAMPVFEWKAPIIVYCHLIIKQVMMGFLLGLMRKAISTVD